MKIKSTQFLPSETPSVHASTIAFYRNKPVFAWFGGSSEGRNDVCIYVQKGKSTITIGNENAGTPYWNPILFPHNGKLFIFTKKGAFCDRWQTDLFDISNSKLIHKICNLPAGCNGPVKTKPIVVKGDEEYSNEYVVCGSSVETAWDWASYIEAYRFTDDTFKLEHRSRPLTIPEDNIDVDFYSYSRPRARGIIQPSLWLDDEGKMNAFFRSSHGIGKIYHASSRFGTGEDIFDMVNVYSVWSDPKPTDLDNPNSGVDTVYMNGRLFLVYNPSSDCRYPLVVAELDSEFKVIDKIEIRPHVDDDIPYNTRELSYPYMIEHDGDLHLTYTYGRKKIEYVVIEV